MDRLHQICESLDEQEQELQALITKLRRDQKTVLPGSLVISGTEDKKRYYYRPAPGQPARYLSCRADDSRVRSLAQQEYDDRLLSAAVQQLASVQKAQHLLTGRELETVYSSMVPARQTLVDPQFPDRARFIKDWEDVTWTPAEFKEDTPEYYSERGERVRSKSEKIIADKYFHLDTVLYRYEYPLVLSVGGRPVTFRPDFMLLNKRTCRTYYHQHLGMMDDPAYVDKNLRKLRLFEENGIFLGEQLFFTYETRHSPFDGRSLDPLIRKYLT